MTITKLSIMIANNINSETLGKENVAQNGQIFIPFPSGEKPCEPTGGGLPPCGGPSAIRPHIGDTNDKIK